MKNLIKTTKRIAKAEITFAVFAKRRALGIFLQAEKTNKQEKFTTEVKTQTQVKSPN